MRTHPGSAAAHRSGFTVLELLIVIVIIGVLAGLLFPVLSGVFTGVGNTEVLADFTKLESAITAFRQEYKVDPYSSIRLHETGANWANDLESKSRIRKIWPQFEFGDTDFNNDSDTTDTHTLTSSEALVFFLGGVESTSTAKNLIGFSLNPFEPFSRTGENRVGPFYDAFEAQRLVDRDSDGFYELLGLASMDAEGDADPIVYASNANGQGYDDRGEDKNNDGTLDAGEDLNGNGVLDGPVNHYHMADNSTPWRKDSFQLIAPGPDGQLGFDAEPSTPITPLSWSADTGASGEQADNLTNFNDSPLGN